MLVVSNRLPFTLERGPRGWTRRPAPGGLVSALEPVLRKGGGTWLGWPGPGVRGGGVLSAPGDPYRIVALGLSPREVAGYYHGFANHTLWPLLHSLPERARLDRREWEVYRRVNRRFAEAACEELEASGGEGAAWIHDYQLLLVPGRMRERRPDTRLAFFLHVPFPPVDLFRLLPWRREILESLLACDQVGFHVRGYADNFLASAERLLGARVDRQAGWVEHAGRRVRVGAFPIGIDSAHFESLARSTPPAPVPGPRLVIGADRLDYTKGIPQRILAVERALELRPDLRERITFLQVAVPSRERVAAYRALKREIDEGVGRVNGRFASAGWSPIHYLHRCLDHPRLAALYRDAEVALVTPLRDGMNLVAKEFVASQVDDPGVLVLSELAGAAESMREALLVNPYDIEDTARVLIRALDMPAAERRARMEALRARERRRDVHAWVADFLAAARLRTRDADSSSRAA